MWRPASSVYDYFVSLLSRSRIVHQPSFWEPAATHQIRSQSHSQPPSKLFDIVNCRWVTPAFQLSASRLDAEAPGGLGALAGLRIGKPRGGPVGAAPASPGSAAPATAQHPAAGGGTAGGAQPAAPEASLIDVRPELLPSAAAQRLVPQQAPAAAAALRPAWPPTRANGGPSAAGHSPLAATKPQAAIKAQAMADAAEAAAAVAAAAVASKTDSHA